MPGGRQGHQQCREGGAVISRIFILLPVAAILLLAASFVHIISMAYLIGVLSGLCLGMVMWFRFNR